MASDPDRRNDPGDRQNNSNESNPPNPFIRFRQFADAQVGSFLQGLIGLPSAFSKNTSGNTRWADFDDDLRRRDDLQTRQKQLKSADAQRNQQEELDGQEGIIPVKKWPRKCSSPYPPQMDKATAAAIPLYSPVHKSLFSHLPQLGDTSPSFKPSNLLNGIRQPFLPEYWPLKLKPDQKSPDFMTNLRYTAYNELNSHPVYQSNYSLLPYLLFSPYSPLKLDHEADHLPSTSKPDNFPYSIAFEDLIMITHGRAALNLPHPYPRCQSPRDGMSWVSLFHGTGILQQKEAKTMNEEIVWDFPNSSPILRKINSRYEEPETEQDMYNWFLRSVTSPAGIADAVESIVETIFENGELAKLMNDIKDMRGITTPEGRQGLRDSLAESDNKDIRELMLELERIGLLPPASERKDVATETESKTESDRQERTNVETDQQEKEPSKISKIHDPNKVISSSTTSEHHTNEDGSVDTTVTVWKKYADGRGTCTVTRHIEDRPLSFSEQKENLEAEKNGENVGEVGDKSKDRKISKGWFWN